MAARPAPNPSSILDPNGQSRTDWSMIRAAQFGDGTLSEDERRALEPVIRRYWPAVFAYLRRTGMNQNEAADVTQDFMCDVLLGRNLIAAADPARGRFRALLLTALRRYLVERHRSETRQCRSNNGVAPLPLEGPVLDRIGQPDAPGPDAAFSAQWAVSLVHEVLRAVREECEADGLGDHWAVFEARVVGPMVFGKPPTPHADLVRQLDLPGPAQAANMIVTVKRRFARALKAEIRTTVRESWSVGEEIVGLLSDLEQTS